MNANALLQVLGNPDLVKILGALQGNVRNGQMKRRRKGKGRVKLPDAVLAANAKQNAQEAEEMFQELGFDPCIATDGPDQNIKSFGRWIAAGRRVIEGTKGHKHPSKGYSLWHIDETRPLTEDEVAKYAAKAE